MTTEELEAVVAELKTMWPAIKIDLGWVAMLAQSTKGLTVEQVRAGIIDLFDEGREFPPGLSQIVYTARFRARNDARQLPPPTAKALPVGAPSESLTRYLDSIGVSSFKEAVAHTGRNTLGWDDEKVNRWFKSKSVVRGMP